VCVSVFGIVNFEESNEKVFPKRRELMNVIAEIQRINEAELQNGSVDTSASWHAKYAHSAWVYVGNLPLQLTEGDVICVMSQFGEIEDVNLVRDDDTGKSCGFAFLKYEDARSCVLAVDNFAGTKILNRSIRVDHVEKYRLPKHLLEKEEEEEKGAALQEKKNRAAPGHAYEGKEIEGDYDINAGQDLFAPPPPRSQSPPPHDDDGDTDDDNDDHLMSKEERKEAKRKRKEARELKRKEKNERRRRNEERRMKKVERKSGHREHRHYSDSHDDDDDEYDRKKKRDRQRDDDYEGKKKRKRDTDSSSRRERRRHHSSSRGRGRSDSSEERGVMHKKR